MAAFLFSDIEGSTKLLERLGDDYLSLLAGYRECLDTAIAAAGGETVDTEGDGHFALFPTASSALQAAVAAQRSLDARSWPQGVSVRARMGLHAGEARFTDEGIVGMEVHRAARISAAGHGGQILLSQPVSDLVADDLPGDVVIRDLGVHRFKDLARSERVFQADVAGLATEFPAIRSLEGRSHNLPVQVTSFIGRETEVEELLGLLDAFRLVTLTGTGGAGKTRLALQTAAVALDRFPDGVWLAELASVLDGDGVVDEVLDALSLRQEASSAAIDTLIRFLSELELLLILDNCEQVLDGAASLADAILRSCPRVLILTTSREALAVGGEALFPVPSLAAPPDDPETDLSAFPAAELFLERATMVRPGLTLDEEQRRAISEICRRLDGIPLAIELAAARVRALTPREIADRLDDRMRLLSAGSRSAPPRHRSLQATMEWSYDLLEEVEAVLLRRLAVFRGGLTVAAVEEVCPGGELAAVEILDALARLVDTSLLVVDDQRPGRYRMLEPVRSFALERLEGAGESDGLGERHAMYFRDLVRDTGQGLLPREQAEWFAELEPDHDNLRAALRWSIDSGDLDLALGLGGGLARFWYRRGHTIEARRWYGEILAGGVPEPSSDLDALLRFSAALAIDAGDFEAAERYVAQEAEVAQAVGDPGVMGRSINLRAGMAWRRGQLGEAAALYEEGIVLLRPLRNPFLVNLLTNDSLLLIEMGDLEAATGLASELGTWIAQKGGHGSVPDLNRVLGRLAHARGDLGDAIAHFESAEADYRELGLKSNLAKTLQELAEAALGVNDVERAQRLATEALEANRDLGDHGNEAESQLLLAAIAIAAEDLDQARTCLDAVRVILVQEDRPQHVALALLHQASVVLAEGDGYRATRLHGASAAIRKGMPLQLYSPLAERTDAELSELRANLGADRFEAAMTEGAKGAADGLDALIAPP